MNSRKLTLAIPILLLLVSSLSSCELIGDIFKSGVYVGVFLVVIVIVAIVWLVTRMGKR